MVNFYGGYDYGRLIVFFQGRGNIGFFQEVIKMIFSRGTNLENFIYQFVTKRKRFYRNVNSRI